MIMNGADTGFSRKLLLFLQQLHTILIHICNMKQFLKTLAASFLGCGIALLIAVLFCMGFIGSIAALGMKQVAPVPASGILSLDFKATVSEREVLFSPLDVIQGNTQSTVSLLDAVRAIDKAAADPAVRFIYMTPDKFTGSITVAEEIRNALLRFRSAGKAVISYTENPGLGSLYLATASDKIYMAPFGNGMLFGLSSNMIYFKDLLDRLGINIQLIRHGKYKSAGEPYISSRMSDENRRQNEEMLRSIWNTLGGSIAEARDLSLGELDTMVNSLGLSDAEDFLSHGLIDGILNKDEMMQNLCTLYGADDESGLSFIPFDAYAMTLTQNFRSPNRVAVVYADGEIVEGEDNRNIGGDSFSKMLSEIRRDTSIRAIVLRVNSPGGSVTAAEKIKREIDILRSQGRTVVASYGSYAASGGYWISAESDCIFTSATTLTGSIGVFSMIPDLGDAAKKVAKLNIYSIKTHEHADMMSLMRPLDKQELAYMQASVDSIYNRFTSLVSEGRGLPVERVDEIAQGRVWSGTDAIGIGLADKIGGIMDAIEYAAAAEGYADYQIVEYPKAMTQLEMLLEELTGTAAMAASPLESAYGKLSEGAGKVYARMPYEYSFNF